MAPLLLFLFVGVDVHRLGVVSLAVFGFFGETYLVS